MTIDSRTLADAIAHVQLHDVRLVEANVRTRVRDVGAIPNADLSVRHATRVIGRSEEGFLVGAMLTAEVSTPAEEPTDNPAVVMHVLFSLEYLLPDASQFSDDVLGEFARVNAVFNAWPYWREYVQTTAARMNLPPLVLPVFRISRTKPPMESVSTQPGAESSTSPPSLHKGARGARKKR